MLFANIDDGYLEGLLRGFRSGVLTASDYANLCQCESIDGKKNAAVSCCLLPAPSRARACPRSPPNDLD